MGCGDHQRLGVEKGKAEPMPALAEEEAGEVDVQSTETCKALRRPTEAPQSQVMHEVIKNLKLFESDCHSHIPMFVRLRHCIQWWKRHASPYVIKLIKSGIQPNWDSPPNLSLIKRGHSMEEVEKATRILEDYAKVGAVVKVPLVGTKHLVPWFIISKQEGAKEKNRLISDCREINSHFCTKTFRLDHLQTIFPYLRKGMWGPKSI